MLAEAQGDVYEQVASTTGAGQNKFLVCAGGRIVNRGMLAEDLSGTYQRRL